MSKLYLSLKIFDEGDPGEPNGDHTGTYTYEQLDEIATSRANHAEKAAVKNYLQRQGVSEEEADAVFERYKLQKEKNKPDITAIEQERDTALKQVEEMKNNNLLRDKGVKADDMDYVMFKVAQLVDDKTDFTKAAEKFLKENPKFTREGAYRVTSSVGTGTQGTGGNANDTINDAIRSAARR